MVFLKNQFVAIWATKAGSFQRKSIIGLGWCCQPSAPRALEIRLFTSTFHLSLVRPRLVVTRQ
jgi:hypothetical protein